MHLFASQCPPVGLAAQSARRQPKNHSDFEKTLGMRAQRPANATQSMQCERRPAPAPHGEGSGSPDVGEEGVDFRTQQVGFAAKRAAVTSLISPMVWPMFWIAPTADVVTSCMRAICERISSVAFAV